MQHLSNFSYAIFILIGLLGTIVLEPIEAQVSYFPFELDANDRISSNDLTLNGNTTLASDYTNCKRVLSFDGNGYAIKQNAITSLTDQFSISFWIKADELDADQKIIGQASIVNFNFRGFVIGVQDSLIKAEVFGQETQGFAGMTNYTLSIWDEQSRITNEWTHIGFSLDQTNTLRLYIDGVLKQTEQYTGVHTYDWMPPLNTDPLILGAAPWDTNFFEYQGAIDDVELFNTRLSDSDMMALANPKCSSYTAIHVDEAATGNQSGADWLNACSDLQEAIHLSCACPSKQIWVKQGSYRPTMMYDENSDLVLEDSEKTFYINKAISMYGGFDGTESKLHDRDEDTGGNTILDGDLGNQDTTFHVMTIEDDDVVINGFSFINGRAGDAFYKRGGGIIHKSASGLGDKANCRSYEFNIENCIFKNNKAEQGGAFYSDRIPSCGGAGLSSCTFEHNDACSGGAIFLIHSGILKIQNTVFNNNTSKNEGGAIYSTGNSNTLEMSDCILNINEAGSDGGAIYVSTSFGNSNLRLFTCNMSGNVSGGSGGVLSTFAGAAGNMYLTVYNSLLLVNQSNNGGAISSTSVTNQTGPSGSTRFDLRQNTIKSNVALTNGGAISTNKMSGDIINCLIIDNSAVDGGCFYFDADRGETIVPRIVNCTIADNQATGIGGALLAGAKEGFSNPGGSSQDGICSPQFINSILWNNTSSTSKEVSLVDLALPSYDRCIVTNAFNSGQWDLDLGEEDGDNLDMDPLFNTVANYRLMDSSPAINWGNPTVLGHPQIDVDLDNNPRIVSAPLVDLGAYENQSGCYADLVFSQGIHDLNNAHNSYRSNETITAYNSIGSSSVVTFRSQAIVLAESFEVQSGSVFEAKPGVCPF